MTVTEVTKSMNDLLTVLCAEASNKAAVEFYKNCLDVECNRDVDDGGLGMERPKVPRGWKKAERQDNRDNYAGVLQEWWKFLKQM